mmetsp:Transcript_3749/g.9135  ORF Transcript_3749/g.9135 Transcript_3749/m.9135 type:complete len:279 (-) Transcript_3749:96-932(-)
MSCRSPVRDAHTTWPSSISMTILSSWVGGGETDGERRVMGGGSRSPSGAIGCSLFSVRVMTFRGGTAPQKEFVEADASSSARDTCAFFQPVTAERTEGGTAGTNELACGSATAVFDRFHVPPRALSSPLQFAMSAFSNVSSLCVCALDDVRACGRMPCHDDVSSPAGVVELDSDSGRRALAGMRHSSRAGVLEDRKSFGMRLFTRFGAVPTRPGNCGAPPGLLGECWAMGAEGVQRQRALPFCGAGGRSGAFARPAQAVVENMTWAHTRRVSKGKAGK